MAKISAEFGKENLSFEFEDAAFQQVLNAFAVQYGRDYDWREFIEGRDEKGTPIPLPNPETKFAFWLRVQKRWCVETVLEKIGAEISEQKRREEAEAKAKLHFDF